MRSWWDTHITQGFKWSWHAVGGHSGIDLAEDNATPLTAAVAGEVVAAGRRAWGGQVSIRFDLGGGHQAVLTYIHMSDIARGISEGASIAAGTYIGRSGGASWSRPIPTTCCSSGPHLHLELSYGDLPPYWHTYEPYRPNSEHYPIDPTNFFYSLKRNGIPNDQSAVGAAVGGSAGQGETGDSGDPGASRGPAAGVSSGETAHAILQQMPGFGGIVTALDAAEKFVPFTPPDARLAPTVGDIELGIGPYSASVHVPGVSDIAHAAAEGQAVSSTITYAFSWLLQNALALIVRAMLILTGLLLAAALLYALARKSAMFLPDTQQVAQAAQLAAVAA